MRRIMHFLAVVAAGFSATLSIVSGNGLRAQGTASRSGAPRVAIALRPAQELLASPRETLRSFYYAMGAYDFFPVLMAEAIACLDLDAATAANSAEAARLAVELDQTLRILCVPLNGVPERLDAAATLLVDGDGFRIALARGNDGLWRFDRDTVTRIPGMYRLALARFRGTQTERSQFRDDFTDPAATMRRFLVDTFMGDFYSAARCLDLGGMDSEERAERGPFLAKKLAFIMQRRSWMYLQEIPNQPNGPLYTWHADGVGRIVLERVRQTDGKEAWLFSRRTVRNIPAMYADAKDRPADIRYVRVGRALSPLTDADDPVRARQRPDDVPPDLGSPRAALKGFFRAMDAAETNDAKLADALTFLDLTGLPASDRQSQGMKVATQLEAVLRKIRIELSALPDEWNADPQVLGESQGVRVELVRLRDGRWRFSQATVTQIPTIFGKLAAVESSAQDQSALLDSPRETMSTFLAATRNRDLERAAKCLDLSRFRLGTIDQVGPVLAYKLRNVIDRIGRVYIQEVPDHAEGPRYIFYRGDLGRIVIARQSEGAGKGNWRFSPETVAGIESMYLALLDQPPLDAGSDSPLLAPDFRTTPGVWVRQHVRAPLRMPILRMQAYQWLGILVIVALAVLGSLLVLAQVHYLVALILRTSGSVLTREFVAAKLRPLTWVTAWWLIFESMTLLDLPVRLLDTLSPLRTLGMAGLIAWFGMQAVDLVTAIYMNSELLRPHRSLSDMIVPFTMRSLKGVILLAVTIYVIYQFGEGDSLGRFLTGLGVLGLAASLAAQDALKSFFSTLLLIGERSFKLGDQIAFGTFEGTVELVGFRATRIRTPDGTLLTVPNSTIASAAIDNRSTKAFSRCKVSLLLNYDTTRESVVALRDALRQWISEQSYLRADKSSVSVNRLTDQGVEVLLDLQLTQVGGSLEKQIREEINCAVLRVREDVSSRAVSYRHPLAAASAPMPTPTSIDIEAA